jgi:GR25 family glycosyltransferase involved in LPS biosynthesis
MGMDIKNTSLVTAIFDIGRDKWDSFGMSYHTYLWWMRNILYLDTNIVIYTEEKFVEDITNYRKEVDPDLQKTIMVVQPLEDIGGYKKFFDPLNNLMGSEEFKSIIGFNVPEMTKPLYNVVMFAKLFYIKDASEKNYFNSDLFVWADAGVIRETNPIKNIRWPDLGKINKLDNNKVTFFCHHSQVRVDKKDYKNHALSQMRFIQGGAVFVPKTCVNEICDLFEKTALECINNGYVGSDEKIFDFVYLTNPENFNLIQCGWREYIDLYTSDEQLLKLKPQVVEVLETYDVVCEWKESEVEKCDDYGFWFFCVEDGEGKLIVRDDIDDPNMLNFSITKKALKIKSSTKPEKFVIWPTSKSKGYLTALKKDIKFVPNNMVSNNKKILIDDYFFVNIDRRKDRLEFIKKEINKSELLTKKIKKWTGVDGREVNPDWIPSSIITKRAYNDITSGLPNARGLSLTPGGLGFYLTHTKLWDYSVEHNKTIFVMDDDIDVNPNFDIELEGILSELPETFDFCYLGYYDTQYEKIPYSEKLFIPKGQFCGPHGYIISPKGAKKLLELSYPIDFQLDSKLYTIQNQVEYYATYERLATYVDEYPTDIQNETGCIKNYEKTEVIKDIDNINFKVVISRYNEDVSWTNQLKYESIVYNKNPEDLDSFENNLPNVGREGHTFMNFIVENYDNLPDYVAFLQGNPFDHCGDVINIINNYDFSSHFVPLGDIVNLSTSHTSINDQIIKYSTEIGFKVTFPVNMVPGAQYIISKDLILKNDIEFYKKILNSLSIGLYPQSGLDLEKTLFQIYGIYDI